MTLVKSSGGLPAFLPGYPCVVRGTQKRAVKRKLGASSLLCTAKTLQYQSYLLFECAFNPTIKNACMACVARGGARGGDPWQRTWLL